MLKLLGVAQAGGNTSAYFSTVLYSEIQLNLLKLSLEVTNTGSKTPLFLPRHDCTRGWGLAVSRKTKPLFPQPYTKQKARDRTALLSS